MVQSKWECHCWWNVYVLMYANVGGLNFLRFFSRIGRYLSKDQEIYEFPGSGIPPPDKSSRSKSFHALRLHFPKLMEARSTVVDHHPLLWRFPPPPSLRNVAGSAQLPTTSTPWPRRWSTWTGCGHSSRWHDEFNPSGQPRSPDQGQKRGADDWFVEPASPPELLGNPTGVSDPNSQIMLGPNEGTLFLKGLKDTSTLMWQISGAATSWIQVQQFQ